MDLIQLSQTIRKVRQKQNMTVEQLAVRSGFSKGFISQVENFRVTPSLNALNRISSALGMELASLFAEGGPSPEYTFGRLDAGEELPRDDNLRYGIRYFALAYSQIGRIMEPFLMEYTPAAEERDFMLHDTEEFFVLLEGNLDYFILNDSGVHRMSPGDTLYMKRNLPHKVRLSEGCSHAKALLIYGGGESNK